MAVKFDVVDLNFILTQIHMAESNQPPVNPHLAFGLRTVGGVNNSTVPGQEASGSADQTFPTVTQQFYRQVTVNVDGTPFDPNPGAAGDTLTTSYATTTPGTVTGTGIPAQFGINVVDSAPRTISNLISDLSTNNPAAVDAAQNFGGQLGDGYSVMNTNPKGLWLPGADGVFGPNPVTGINDDIGPADTNNLFIGNITPDNGLSAPSNSFLTFFGQFFDHGLDLITKGGNGLVYIPLQPDDPLYVAGSPNNFMLLNRATDVSILPGADGIVGTSDDIHKHVNTDTPWVDLSQAYTSAPAHQAFLREYVTGADNVLHSTGKLLQGRGADNVLGTADDNGLPTWADIKANALKLGILLTDYNVDNVPTIATDLYGNIQFNAVTGRVQFVTTTGLVDAGTPGAPAAVPANVILTGHNFINDKAAGASPFNSAGNPRPPGDGTGGTYNAALLDSHYIAGDGRANENVALTSIHDMFLREHDRLVDQTKALVQQELNNGNVSFAQNWVLPGININPVGGVAHVITASEWNGERLFQAARFGTETQYQHLVFEEFVRYIDPTVHVFGNVNISLDPAITSEFANAVYRFGHSMLDENVPLYQLNPDGTMAIDNNPFQADGVTPNANFGKPLLTDMGLIQAFTNPLSFAAGGSTEVAQIIQGTTHQIGSEIDEFVTGAVRNNLLGQPLDLAALNIARGRDTGVAPLNEVRNQIFAATGDTKLKPYSSWDDFRQFLKHDLSIINFVAAYGTHASITAATTIADKRAAALNLVTMGVDPASDPNNTTTNGTDAAHIDAWNFMHSLGAYANNLASPLAVHSQWSTGNITGLDNVDLWIGGLAEKKALFGSFLGSTFEFIFRTQMEHLQDADRLYYLPRIEGTHWSHQIESDSFAELIMTNEGVKHLAHNVFLTPEYTVEAGTVTNDPTTWLKNPVSGAYLVEKLADGTVHFIGDDNFLGNTMVLGGTSGNDKLIAGQADDDTVWGDDGNDTIDGANGNDFLHGGTGNDVITDSNGDNTAYGEDGNDRIVLGRGDDIAFGGDGNDFIDGGQGLDDLVGGTGNDIIIGGEGADEIQGNEGDDWIEGGVDGDNLVGDVGAPTGQVPLYGGNDVLIGGAGGGDVMKGFSGDDIMLGYNGFDKFDGLLGFDWASHEQATQGVDVDMNRKLFVPQPGAPAGDAVRDVFQATEGWSGSRFDDSVLGTNDAKADTFNELTNTNLIVGLDNYFDPLAGPVHFSGGNILLGGGGSDAITGNGGNDIIDGDARLHVELIGGANPGSQILRIIKNDQAVAPTFGPGGVALTAGDVDTAVFNDVAANYTISRALDAAGNARFAADGSAIVQVTHNTVTARATNDGTDLLWHIERLQFADTTIANPFAVVVDRVPTGAVTISDNGAAVVAATTAAAVGDVLSFASTVADPDGIAPGTLQLNWQAQDVAGKGWFNISGATGATFSPTLNQIGQALRLQISFTDGLGHKETVFSQITAPTVHAPVPPGPNLAPTVVTQVAVPGIPDTTALEDTALGTATNPGTPLDLINIFTDDSTPSNLLVYTATLAGTLNGVNVDGLAIPSIVQGAAIPANNIAGITGLALVLIPDPATPGAILGARLTGTPPANYSGPIDVRVTATDTGGLSVQDTFTINVLPVDDGPAVLTINGGRVEGNVLTATLGPDPDGPGTTPVFHWLRDGVTLFSATGTSYTLTAADVGHVITAEAQYIDGQGFSEDVFSNGIGPVVQIGNLAPIVTGTLSGSTAANAAFSANLLTNAVDGNQAPLPPDPLSVANPDGTITTTNGTVLTLGTDFTVSGGTFALTAAGQAKFAPLGAAATDSFTFHYGVTDTFFDPVADQLTVSVSGVNDAPTDIVLAPAAAPANALPALGTVIGTLTTKDVDIGDTATYSLQTGSSTSFTVNAVTGAISVGTALANGQTHVLNLLTTDSGGLSFAETMTVRDGSGGGETITGDAGTDIVYGLGGNDRIDGAGGDDALFGQTGNDIIIGGTGNDIVDSGGGNDNLVATTGFGSDTVLNFDTARDRIAIGTLTGRTDGLGITAGTFATRVSWVQSGADTLVTLKAADGVTVEGTMRLVGVAANTITQAQNFNTNPTGLSIDSYHVQKGLAGAIVGNAIVHDDLLDTHTFVITNDATGLVDDRFEIVDSDPNAPGEQLVLKLKDGVALDAAFNKADISVQVFDSAGQASPLNPYHFSITANHSPGGSGTGHVPSTLVNNAITINSDVLLQGFSDSDLNAAGANDTLTVANLVATNASVTDNHDGTFTITPATGFTGTLQLTYDVDDGHGALTPASQTLKVRDHNNGPGGNIKVNDSTPTKGHDLHAQNTITDPNGGVQPGSITYQWESSSDGGLTWKAIAGAHGETFDPTAAQVGKMIHVVTTYTDGDDYTESVTSAPTAVVGDQQTGTTHGDSQQGTGGSDDFSGSVGDDSIAGMAGDDLLSGDDGNDTVDGGSGKDDMSGGSGDDHMAGGSDDDDLNGGDGDDDMSGDQGNDHMAGGSGDDHMAGGDGDDDMQGGDGDDNMNGGSGNDAMQGSGGSDRENGGSGDDDMNGGTGSDWMQGSLGNDAVSGGGGNDTVIGGDGDDTVSGGAGNDSVYGGSGNDFMSGGDGADALRGGAGNDTLSGGHGADYLVGGKGADVFVFGKGDGHDYIVDLGKSDKIDLSGLDFGDANVLQQGNNFTVDFGNGDSITIHGVGQHTDLGSFFI